MGLEGSKFGEELFWNTSQVSGIFPVVHICCFVFAAMGIVESLAAFFVEVKVICFLGKSNVRPVRFWGLIYHGAILKNLEANFFSGLVCEIFKELLHGCPSDAF